MRLYLRRRYPFWARANRKKAQQIAERIPNLAVRPMLLAHIPDVVASNENIQSVSDLYKIMNQAWLIRESYWVDQEALKRFSERVAVDLYINRELRGAERITLAELIPLAKTWGIELEQWQISGRSLLNRDALGNFKFAHRSIMEYLFVEQAIAGNSECERIVLTDQMKIFLAEWFTVVEGGDFPLELLNKVDLALESTNTFATELDQSLGLGLVTNLDSRWFAIAFADFRFRHLLAEASRLNDSLIFQKMVRQLSKGDKHYYFIDQQVSGFLQLTSSAIRLDHLMSPFYRLFFGGLQAPSFYEAVGGSDKPINLNEVLFQATSLEQMTQTIKLVVEWANENIIPTELLTLLKSILSQGYKFMAAEIYSYVDLQFRQFAWRERIGTSPRVLEQEDSFGRVSLTGFMAESEESYETLQPYRVQYTSKNGKIKVFVIDPKLPRFIEIMAGNEIPIQEPSNLLPAILSSSQSLSPSFFISYCIFIRFQKTDYDSFSRFYYKQTPHWLLPTSLEFTRFDLIIGRGGGRRTAHVPHIP